MLCQPPMRWHWPTPAINWPPLMAGPAAPTASPAGGVHGPGPRPAARLGLAVASGKIAARVAATLTSFVRVMVVSMFEV
nr:hypothetical protein BDOA9_0127800 [Bradyrhizobium sp. DOA9]